MCELSTAVMALEDMDMSCKQFKLLLTGWLSVEHEYSLLYFLVL